jgi:hypothetical protein
MESIKQIFMVLSFSAIASIATGQTTNIILQTDFDGDAGEGNLNFSYGYAVAGSSAGSVLAGFSGGITGGAGTNGTFANAISPDYTLLPSDPNWTNAGLAYVYAVCANGTSFTAPITPVTPTSVMGSLVLSADIQVTGLLPALNNADVTVSKVQFTSNSVVLFDFTGDAGNIGSNFVHIAIPLSSLSYGGANGGDATLPLSEFTNPAVISSIDGFTIEFAVEGLPVGTIGGNPLISPPYGFTDTGELVVDNIQLIQTGNTVPTPVQEITLAQINFDNHPASATYGYSFSDVGGIPVTAVTNNIGVGGSVGLEVTADASSWATTPPQSFSGWGVGAQSLIPPITSSNASSYRLYISVMAGRFLPGVTSGPGAVSLQFLAPDGTLSASNGQPDVVFELEPNITLSSNYQAFVFDGGSMPPVNYNGGSQALFNQYVSKVYAVNVQAQANGDVGATPTIWGYDTNNTVAIDNIKLVQLVTGMAPLSVTRTNGQLKVYWTDPATGGFAKLQSSTNASGPYLDVTGASSGVASPYVVPAGLPRQFFRTVWVP